MPTSDSFLPILLPCIQSRTEKSYQKHFLRKTHCRWNLTLCIVLMVIDSNPAAKVPFLFKNGVEFPYCLHSACGYVTVLIHLRSDSRWNEYFLLPLPLLSSATLWGGGSGTSVRWKLTQKKWMVSFWIDEVLMLHNCVSDNTNRAGGWKQAPEGRNGCELADRFAIVWSGCIAETLDLCCKNSSVCTAQFLIIQTRLFGDQE